MSRLFLQCTLLMCLYKLMNSCSKHSRSLWICVKYPDSLHWLVIAQFLWRMSQSFALYEYVLSLSRPGTLLTVQALSEDDYRFWLQAMGGKEPVSYVHLSSNTVLAVLRHNYPNWYVFKTWKRHRDASFSNRLATPLRGLTLKREEVCDLAAVNNCIRKNHNISSFRGFGTFILSSLLITTVDAQLDDVGLCFLKNSINAIETRGELRFPP